MKKMFKKYFVGFVTFCLFFSQTAFATGINNMIGNQSYTTLEGSVNVVPINTNYTFGSASKRWASIYATDLNISGVFTLSGTMGSNFDMDGYNIVLDQDGDSQIVNDRDGGVADDAFDLQFNSARDFTFSANLLSLLAGSDFLIADGHINADKVDTGAVVDGTRNFDFVTTASTSPAAGAEVNNGYFAYNWTAGDNQNFIANGLEGVVRSQGADESMTARGVYGRFYIDPAASATLRTGVGVEASARASYSGGTEIAAEAGTAFVGSRIWMAPYFSAATVNNVNNFYGLWIYGEHATQRNGDAAIKISDAGGGFTDDLVLQEGTKIRNAIAGNLTFQGNGAVNDEDLTFDFETTPDAIGASSSTGVADLNFSGIDLNTTTEVSAENLVSTDDADITDNLTAGDIVIDEAAGVLDFTGATSATVKTVVDLVLDIGSDFIKTTDNKDGIFVNIPVTGVDASEHQIGLQIDGGNGGLFIKATGDGGGSVGATTNQIGVSDKADVTTIGDSDANVSITDADWSITTAGVIRTVASLVLEDPGVGVETVTIQSPTIAGGGSWTLTLPTDNGSSSQFLQTDGNGVTSWQTVPTPELVAVTLATASGATAATAENSAGITWNVPVTGTDAGAHAWTHQIDGNTFLSATATGDGAGGIGALTTNLGLAAGVTNINTLVTYPNGQAVTAGSYQIGRDADGTNQLHFNVPTGATMEWSINDVSIMGMNSVGLGFGITPTYGIHLNNATANNRQIASTDGTAIMVMGVGASNQGIISMVGAHNLLLATNSQVRTSYNTIGNQAHTFTAGTSGVPIHYTLTGAAHTGLTAATEDMDVYYNLTATKTWAAGAGPLATQRDFVIAARTYNGNAGTPLTITEGSTLDISSGPIQGTNLTLSNSYTITAGKDTDAKAIFGRAALWSPSSDFAGFSHYDQRNAAGGYAVMQNTNGATTINSGSGQTTNFAINNAARIALTANTITFTPQTVAGGAVSLTFTPPTHTAVATEKVDYIFADHAQTINSGATIALARSMTLGGVTYGGVAGGGTETVTLAITLDVNPPVQGSDLTLTEALAARFNGGVRMTTGRFMGTQGADVASASTIVLGGGNIFELTGTTAVDLITTTGWQNGSEITLIANENVTINHGTATSGANITILLSGAGNFAMTANDTLTLVLSETTAGGQAWREKSRTAI